MNLLEKARGVLTPRELEYFEIMYAKAGTLYVQGPPGGGKSAIFKSIAHKLGCIYLAFDAPAMDETQLGLYPDKVKQMVNDKEITFVVDLPPLWAADAMNSTVPVIIAIEEMNRNIKLVNGILNILNERRIGYQVDFNKAKSDVLIAATGNMGEADGTVVEEFDEAQWGRLIVRDHRMEGQEGLTEWITSFAGVPTAERPKGAVHPFIVEYLKREPADFRPDVSKNSDSGKKAGEEDGGRKIVLDGRRWTFLSEYLIANVGYEAKAQDIATAVRKTGHAYIGGTYSRKFLKFLEEQRTFTVEDVLKGRASKAERENAQELVEQLLKLDYPKLKQKEMDNILNFVATLDAEMRQVFIQDFAMGWNNYTSKKEGGQGKHLPFKDLLMKRFAAEIAIAKETELKGATEVTETK